ncbi:hypothetical protein QUF86_10535 [Peribacillus sp. NJ11]|uniref:hypothetical protein n=1 Tax=Peribacillus sp. NJ11 TaxID=3055861 RepID=UPI0025A16AAC|nr:hypothetical protein [Peribacillus sp. NJ11]MDM5221152.1 hypothetical protein [Peribacillus sp. NJ11]
MGHPQTTIVTLQFTVDIRYPHTPKTAKKENGFVLLNNLYEKAWGITRNLMLRVNVSKWK